MNLSDLEKFWLLYKFDADNRFGFRGNSVINESDLPIFISMADKGLVETKDDISKPHPSYSLTDTGEIEARHIFNISDADELERIGHIKQSQDKKLLPLPKGCIFMAKKVAQTKFNQTKN
jgi:hypothetical protein